MSSLVDWLRGNDWFRLSPEIIGLSGVSAEGVWHSGSAFMPSAFTAENWVLEDGASAEDRAKRIGKWRKGYRPAVLQGLILSGAMTGLTRSAYPAIFGAAAVVLMLYQYERILPAKERLPASRWPGFLLTGQYVDPAAPVQPANPWRLPGA